MNGQMMRHGLARAALIAQTGAGPLEQLGHVLVVVGNIMTLRLSTLSTPSRKWGGSSRPEEKEYGIARYNLTAKTPHAVLVDIHGLHFKTINNSVLVGASKKATVYKLYVAGREALQALAVIEGKPVCQTIGTLDNINAASVLDQLYEMYTNEALLTNSTAAVDESAVRQSVSDAIDIQELLGR